LLFVFFVLFVYFVISLLFEQRDLAGMVEIVLDHTVEHEVNRVVSSRRGFFELFVVDFPDCIAQGFVALFKFFQSSLPGRFAGIADGREIVLVRNLRNRVTFQAPANDLFPGINVIDQFLDAVNRGDWFGGGLISCHAFEQFAQ